ncbi:MAG: ATP-NAD kinase family protein [Alphaproteobacteria bacterium]|nr:ATP-NAD kinase family protein [Alphaproteobacteria bacterium]
MGAKIGLIVNPIAGMGGKVGLKGTDGNDILSRARELGAEPIAHERAGVALSALAVDRDRLEILTYDGVMGADDVLAANLGPIVVGQAATAESRATDTQSAVEAMCEHGVDLILFAGGDGTARDIFEIVSNRVPILGIPTGVKMHSAVFSTGPGCAGRLAAAYVLGRDPHIRLVDAEVMDIDEDAQRRNRLSARLYGHAKVPYERKMMQHAKATATATADADLGALAADIANGMEGGAAYIFGPGGSTHRILDHLRLDGTLLGVDVVRDGALIGRDASEAELLSLLDGGPARIVTGVIGGQGFVFGRGNQQISGEVIRRVGTENVIVVASAEKLIALKTDRLLVDTGDDEIDAALAGFRPVHTAPGRTMMLEVVAA